MGDYIGHITRMPKFIQLPKTFQDKLLNNFTQASWGQYQKGKTNLDLQEQETVNAVV